MLKYTFYFVGFFFLSFSSTELSALSSDQASAHIMKLHGRVARELVGNMSASTRQNRFRGLLRQTFDLGKISRFVLGSHWRRANAQQRQNFKRVFENYLVRSYAGSFSSYGGNDFRITKVSVNPKRNTALVRTSVMVRKKGGGKAPANIVWRLKNYGGAFKIIDVSVENVSMSITKRKEFASILRGNGGQVNGLIQKIAQSGGRVRRG